MMRTELDDVLVEHLRSLSKRYLDMALNLQDVTRLQIQLLGQDSKDLLFLLAEVTELEG